jgi:hypothetical protein
MKADDTGNGGDENERVMMPWTDTIVVVAVVAMICFLLGRDE